MSEVLQFVLGITLFFSDSALYHPDHMELDSEYSGTNSEGWVMRGLKDGTVSSLRAWGLLHLCHPPRYHHCNKLRMFPDQFSPFHRRELVRL